ncbi:MAG: hypothetical protein GX051_10415 [Clostridiales bacterium]|nr:hypothetical protein [Clostridiales bacterium]
MTITEKVSYLKGLADGLGLDKDAKETKLFNSIIDILGDLSLSVADLEDDVDEIVEQLDAVDEDLSDLEEFVYDDCDDECGCWDDDEECYEVECPSCGEIIYLDEDMLDEDEIECPSCGETLELDIECDGDCDCCCDDADDE